jgi:hypothetical protein
MFVSIHIPKTAGTALAKIFDETSLRRIMYDYGTERDLVAARTCLPEIKEHKSFIQSYFFYLHGHFHYLKYADIFHDSPFITMVRHPVDRVVSQYLHILRSGDRHNARHKMIMDGEMDVVDFSRIKFIGNAQWYYLEGRPIKDYDFIFIQEELEHSLHKFSVLFGKPEISEYLSWFNGVPAVNKKPSTSQATRSIKITEAERQEIWKYCKQDVEVYQLAKEKLRSL